MVLDATGGVAGYLSVVQGESVHVGGEVNTVDIHSIPAGQKYKTFSQYFLSPHFLAMRKAEPPAPEPMSRTFMPGLRSNMATNASVVVLPPVLTKVLPNISSYLVIPLLEYWLVSRNSWCSFVSWRKSGIAGCEMWGLLKSHHEVSPLYWTKISQKSSSKSCFWAAETVWQCWSHMVWSSGSVVMSWQRPNQLPVKSPRSVLPQLTIIHF